MSRDNVNNHTRRTIFSQGFFRSGILQILAWPLLCVILAAGLWYWTLSKIDGEKRAAEKKVLAEATALCNDYAHYLAQAIEQANQITLQLQYSWEQSHGNINLQELSKGGLFRNPHINNVIVVNREGRPATATVGNLQNVSFTDRAFFIYHKNDDSKALLVGKPLVSRTTGKSAVPFSRRLNTQHGAFDGIALVGFDPHYLTSFYAGSFPGSTGVLMVAGLDGTLRSATIGGGTHDSTPAALRAVPLFNAAEGATYLSGEQWFGDKRSRYVAWKTLERYPLVAMVGLSEQDYFAPYQNAWATDRRVAIAGSSILFLFALAAAGMSRRLVRKKHQEEQVRKAYRIATEGGNEGFYMYEALCDKSGAIVDFVLVDCNERGAGFYGIPQAQLLQTKLSSLYSGAHFDEIVNIFRTAMAAGFYEDETGTPGESTLQIEWSKRRVVRSGNGLAVTVQDISERKRAEEELRRINERFVLATHAGQVGVWDWDIPNNELVWDNSMYSLYGIQRGDFGGAYEAWIGTIHPEDKAHTEREIQAALRGDREYAPEFRIVRPDGTIRYLKADSQTFRAEDGKPLRMIGTNIDISELKHAEEQVRLLNEQLEQRVQERTAELMERGRELQENQRALMNIVDDLNQKTEELEQANARMQELDQLKSLFIASMSHELRTPLNSIIGFSSILKDEWLGPVNPEQKENLATILRSGKHLLNLINDVIDVSKIEAGKIEIRFEEFDLYDLLKEAIQYIEHEIREKGLQLELQLLHHELRTDRRRLLQCVLNLLSNAVKFTEQGCITLSSSVETIQPWKPECIVITVSDTGIGIAEADTDRLFKPFVRLESPLQTLAPGTGLGLYLTKKLIEEVLDGSITCSSALGAGSAFTLSIPERLYEKGTGSRG